MGERSWARLTIRGWVARTALAEALESLAGLRPEDCLEGDQVVVEDPEGPRGAGSQGEAWLEARGIPFDLECGACPGAWPDMLVHFRPGRGTWSFSPTTVMASDDPALGSSGGADPLPDPEGSAHVARMDVRGDACAAADHLDAGRPMHELSDTEAVHRIWDCLSGVLEGSADTLEVHRRRAIEAARG
jgi:hypothetical protein